MTVQRSEIDPLAVKAASESWILGKGGKVCDWLPVIDLTQARTSTDVAERALVLNAMIQIGFGAPPSAIANWLRAAGLEASVSPAERTVLALEANEIDKQLKINLSWRIEALWALMWVGGRVAELDATAQAGHSLAGMFPSIRDGEMPANFIESFQVRSCAELYSMRDLYYRLNWLTRDAELNRYSATPFHNGVVVERRWALEWATEQGTEWDEVDLST